MGQCLLDVGVPVTWIRSFHAESPHVIVHKSKPPLGSVPVGLYLPPISFHHVDLDTLAQLERMHFSKATIGGLPFIFDFSPFLFRPLQGKKAESGEAIQINFGYEVLLTSDDLIGRTPKARCVVTQYSGRVERTISHALEIERSNNCR